MKALFILGNLLTDRGMTGLELARLTGISPQTIIGMCDNTVDHLPLENTATICGVLECEISDILTLEKEPTE